MAIFQNFHAYISAFIALRALFITTDHAYRQPLMTFHAFQRRNWFSSGDELFLFLSNFGHGFSFRFRTLIISIWFRLYSSFHISLWADVNQFFERSPASLCLSIFRYFYALFHECVRATPHCRHITYSARHGNSHFSLGQESRRFPLSFSLGWPPCSIFENIWINYIHSSCDIILLRWHFKLISMPLISRMADHWL
jgi:hypothetical protein